MLPNNKADFPRHKSHGWQSQIVRNRLLKDLREICDAMETKGDPILHDGVADADFFDR